MKAEIAPPSRYNASRLEPFASARYQFAEPAVRLRIVQERQLFFFELLEKLVPIDRCEGILAAVAREVDPQQSCGFAPTFRSFNRRGRAATRLDPFPDFVVINRHVPLRARCSARTGATLRTVSL